MPLSQNELASSLANQWLTTGNNYPDSVVVSADRFAQAVATWFSTAMALTFPCTTAQGRKEQLKAQAIPALSAGLPQAAGQQLAMAVASYVNGQSFGAGIASFPIALAGATPLFITGLATLDLPQNNRANIVAQGCLALALSTLVVFPPPTPPAPIL